MKKVSLLSFYLIFLMLFLSGCGGPSNEELAFMGLFGNYSIFLISLLTLYAFDYCKSKREIKFKMFYKNNKLLFKILLALVALSFLVAVFIDSTDGGLLFLLPGVFVFISTIISTITYTIILLFLFFKITKKNSKILLFNTNNNNCFLFYYVTRHSLF